jgi:hypothetical protein
MTNSYQPAPISPFPQATPLPPQRGWWSRNWKWFLPVGCLLPILLCGGFLTTIIVVVMGAIRSSEPYQHALSQARSNAEVQAAIGTPIEPGLFPVGTININNDAGDANLTISVSGPKGAGVIYVLATKKAGVWSYSRLSFRSPTISEPVDLSK